MKEVLAASHAHTAVVSSRAGTRPCGHPPAHRALSEFAFLAFTLHRPIYSTDNWELTREENVHFNTSPVKANEVKPSPLFSSTSTICIQKVKR